MRGRAKLVIIAQCNRPISVPDPPFCGNKISLFSFLGLIFLPSLFWIFKIPAFLNPGFNDPAFLFPGFKHSSFFHSEF